MLRRMMIEWGVPPVELHTLLYGYLKQLADRNEFVPAVAAAAAFTRHPSSTTRLTSTARLAGQLRAF